MSSPILTSSRLAQLSTQFPLLKDNWHYLTAATLTACNQPSELPLLYHYTIFHQQHIDASIQVNHELIYKSSLERVTLFEIASATDNNSPILSQLSNPFNQSNNTESQIHLTEKFKESLIKSIALIGLPRVINSMMILKTHTSHPLRAKTAHRDFEETPDQITTRAKKYWNTVYKGSLAPRIAMQLETASPDLWGYTLTHAYGALLSYSGILSPSETSLLILCCLIPQDVNPQLKGHLKGAVNNGCTKGEIEQGRELGILVSSWCGVSWKDEVAKLKL